MADVIEGAVTPEVANAACNAGRQMLRVVEMQYRYGGSGADRSPIVLSPLAVTEGRR